MSNEQKDAAEFASLTAASVPAAVKPPSRAVQAEPAQPEQKRSGMASQYAEFNGKYYPTTSTVPRLEAGCYDIYQDQQGTFAAPALPPTGLLLELPDMRSDAVITLVENFWNSEGDYKDGNEFVRGGAQFKSGIMLYGPPGSGKSCTIKILCKKLVERGGIVFYGSAPSMTNHFLANFSRIEGNRKCIVIFEDFDTLIESFGESGYLEMLDSAKTIDNVMFIATTNYPERLDARIYNRPGRFSHVIKVGLPTAKARDAFLRAILKNHKDVDYIVDHTQGFSVDHLSALINSVYREKKELTAEIERLRTLFKVPKADEAKTMGLIG